MFDFRDVINSSVTDVQTFPLASGLYWLNDGKNWGSTNDLGEYGTTWDYTLTLEVEPVPIPSALWLFNAALGVSSSPCDGKPTTRWTDCGTISGWTRGDFGTSYNGYKEHFAFVNDGNGPAAYQVIGLGYINYDGSIVDEEYWSDAFSLDHHGYGSSPDKPINLLLYKDNAFPVVPVPATLWLFGSGLLGLVGMARRKAA